MPGKSPHVTVRLERRRIDALDYAAEKMGLSRGKLCADLISIGWRALTKEQRKEAIAHADALLAERERG